MSMERGTVHRVPTEALPDAVAALIAAQVDYAAVQATATVQLAGGTSGLPASGVAYTS